MDSPSPGRLDRKVGPDGRDNQRLRPRIQALNVEKEEERTHMQIISGNLLLIGLTSRLPRNEGI
ncbi:unnamed protein product [Penicillium manginii]